MARDYSQEYLQEKNALRSSGAWVWVYTIMLNRGGAIYRLTNNPEPITYQPDPEKSPITFEPAGVAHGEIERNKSADVTGTTLTISNVDRKAEAALENHGGLRGARVTIRKIHTAHLDMEVPFDTYRVRSAGSDENSVTLRLISSPIFSMTFPKHEYSRTSCRVPFKSTRCGWFNPNGGTASNFCDHTQDGPRGCEYHGQLHEAVGLPKLWPERFGGFLQIPKRAGP